MKCCKCEGDFDPKESEMFLTNENLNICNSCSWFWPVDNIHNVLINPFTISMTRDTWVGLGIFYGFYGKDG